jgi:DNA-binding NarL/FixJ family response regulator
VRVVIADDSVLLREGLARLLTEAGFEVVGQVGDSDELLLKVRSYSPDVAIVDIRMPPTHTDEGIAAARRIRLAHPETAVLVLSQHVQHAYAVELLGDGAAGLGYLLKERVSDVRESPPPCGASARAGLRSTRSSSRSSWGGIGATTP